MSGPRLSIIPAGAIFDRTLEGRDLQVLGLLGCHTDKAGWCRRSQVKMARQINCGRSSVQRSLDRLVEAGWVEKKRPPGGNDEGQPSSSYMYRVILDRDDVVMLASDDTEADDTESHAETASEEGGCPSVGTPGAQPEGHPGAQPYVGTGAHTYVGTKNVPLERPLLERERDARARDRKARFLANFEKRWPTAAADDRQRTAYAADALTEDEEEGALAGIGLFLENLKKLGRKGVPAGWRYLEEKRWTLLEAQKAEQVTTSTNFARDSIEAKAIIVLHDIAGRSEAVRTFMRGPNGTISFRKPITAQLLALAQAPPAEDWVIAGAAPPQQHGQAPSWERLLREFFDPGLVRVHIREGSRVPWPFAPSKEGVIYPPGASPPAPGATGSPENLMTDQDYTDFQ